MNKLDRCLKIAEIASYLFTGIVSLVVAAKEEKIAKLESSLKEDKEMSESNENIQQAQVN